MRLTPVAFALSALGAVALSSLACAAPAAPRAAASFGPEISAEDFREHV